MFNCLKESKILGKLHLNIKFLVKLSEKVEIFLKFAWKNRIFLPGSTTPQILNRIDAAGLQSTSGLLTLVFSDTISQKLVHNF